MISFSTDDAGSGNITFRDPGGALSTSGGLFFFDAGADLTLASLGSSRRQSYLVAGSQGAGRSRRPRVQTSGGAGGAAGDVIFTADSLSLASPVDAGSPASPLSPTITPRPSFWGAFEGGLLG